MRASRDFRTAFTATDLACLSSIRDEDERARVTTTIENERNSRKMMKAKKTTFLMEKKAVRFVQTFESVRPFFDS